MPPSPQGIYSPRWLTDAAHAVMGGIDLDPCSCLVANSVVRAKEFYTAKDDGLNLPWYGNLYLNPPFEETKRWIGKLRQEEQVEQVILVAGFSVSWYQWFHWVWDEFVICLPRRRIAYWHPARADSTPTSFVGYWGPRQGRFFEVFRDRGTLLKRVN